MEKQTPPSLAVRMQRLAGVFSAACVLFGASAAVAQPISAEQIARIVASPDRSAADRTNDVRRKPEPMLAFLAIRPGIVAFDLSAAGGYTTELLARAVGPTGKVYGQSQPRDPNRPLTPPAAPEGNSNPTAAAAAAATAAAAPGAAPPSPAATAAAAGFAGPPRTSAMMLADRSAKMQAAGTAAAPIIAVPRPFADPFPPELAAAKVDLVTLMFNYHDLGHMGVDRAAMNRAVFQALKPGGIYAIADQAGRPGTGISESGTLHRIEEAFLRQEVEAAGFRLADEATFLRNPNDPRDKNTPDPPQPKDEFVVKFVKP